MTPDTERLLKVAQVARMAFLSERTVWRDIRAGRLQVVQMPLNHQRRTRVRLSEAKRYAALSECAKPSEP